MISGCLGYPRKRLTAIAAVVLAGLIVVAPD